MNTALSNSLLAALRQLARGTTGANKGQVPCPRAHSHCAASPVDVKYIWQLTEKLEGFSRPYERLCVSTFMKPTLINTDTLKTHFHMFMPVSVCLCIKGFHGSVISARRWSIGRIKTRHAAELEWWICEYVFCMCWYRQYVLEFFVRGERWESNKSLICVQANPPRYLNYCNVCFLYVANKINHLLLCVSGACVCVWVSAYTVGQCICVRLNSILDIDYCFSFFIAVKVLYCWFVRSVCVYVRLSIWGAL